MYVFLSAICASHLTPGFCSGSFRDGVCDLDCDSERQLFDGYDCADELPVCQETYVDYCAGRFANGICDESCNNEPCLWDGGDCITESIKFADDTLVLYLSDWSRGTPNAIDLKELGRSLSKLLRTIVRILPDEVEDDIARFQAAQAKGKNLQLRPRRVTRDNDFYHSNQRLRIKLDNTKCKQNCFKKASRAAEFIALASRQGWNPGIPISALAGEFISFKFIREHVIRDMLSGANQIHFSSVFFLFLNGW